MGLSPTDRSYPVAFLKIASSSFWCHECRRWQWTTQEDETYWCKVCGETIQCDECGAVWTDAHGSAH